MKRRRRKTRHANFNETIFHINSICLDAEKSETSELFYHQLIRHIHMFSIDALFSFITFSIWILALKEWDDSTFIETPFYPNSMDSRTFWIKKENSNYLYWQYVIQEIQFKTERKKCALWALKNKIHCHIQSKISARRIEDFGSNSFGRNLHCVCHRHDIHASD